MAVNLTGAKVYKLYDSGKFMSEAIVERLSQQDTFPLRILGREGKKYLACPYELTSDNLEVTFLFGNPRIAHFQVVSTDGKSGFNRHFLYSKAGQRRLVTASGYLFTGKVDVYSWKARENPRVIGSEDIAILPTVELLHFRGDEENKTGGLDDAIAKHTKRIDGLNVDILTIPEAMKFYDSMRHHVPRY